MQFRHFFLFVTFLLFLLGAGQVSAQKITTNEKGEKIIVYPNGTWKYFNEASAPVIEAEEVAEEKKSDDLQGDKKAERRKKKASKKRNKNKEAVAETQKPERAKKKKKEKVTDSEEKAGQQAATRRAEMAAAAETKAQLEWEDARLRKDRLEAELESADKNANSSVDEIMNLKQQSEQAGEEEKIAAARLKECRKKTRQMEKMIDMSKSKRDKLLAKMEGDQTEQTAPKIRKRQTGEEVFVDNAFKNTQPYIAPTKTFAVYHKEKDVMINPPDQPCELTFDGVDEFSGKSRRDVARKNLFAYTSDQMRPYLKGREYITCDGYLSAISGGFKLLYLHFEILSENAQREFGVLEKGSILSIKFIDGSNVKLSNSKTDSGLPNSLEKSVTYRAQYIIDSAAEKLLRRKEVDKIRVVWGTGYEDYEVYDLDFFADQFRCLDIN